LLLINLVSRNNATFVLKIQVFCSAALYHWVNSSRSFDGSQCRAVQGRAGQGLVSVPKLSPYFASHVFCLSDVLCAATIRTDQQLRCTMQSASHCFIHVQPNISIVYSFLCSLLVGNDAVLLVCSSSFCKHVRMVKYIFFFPVPLLQYRLYPIVW
jgi:hypothetical protein